MDYIKEAIRTESGELHIDTSRRAKNRVNDRLLHAAIGISTEAGELLDAMKKAMFYGKDLDRVNLKEELGDLFWYMAILADELGVTFEQVQERNIEKLRARYPDKFTLDQAENRDLKAERKILERGVKGDAARFQRALQTQHMERHLSETASAVWQTPKTTRGGHPLVQHVGGDNYAAYMEHYGVMGTIHEDGEEWRVVYAEDGVEVDTTEYPNIDSALVVAADYEEDKRGADYE